jgi:hypothetical protein
LADLATQPFSYGAPLNIVKLKRNACKQEFQGNYMIQVNQTRLTSWKGSFVNSFEIGLNKGLEITPVREFSAIDLFVPPSLSRSSSAEYSECSV